ncbi:hypothetical protein B0H14DRAFT_3585930 [Mycena olivaceomarginata]|nr:hypothetical protein B0H14DRAFT_3585930 [Mycena olivaceomarginata]
MSLLGGLRTVLKGLRSTLLGRGSNAGTPVIALLSCNGKPYPMPEDYKEHDTAEFRQYANRPFTKKCIGTALGIGNGPLTADKKLFTSSDIPYDPLAEKWVNGDVTLDAKDKACFDKMSGLDWTTHLADAKKKKLPADKLAADKAARRAREKWKSRHQEHQSGLKKRKHFSNGSSLGSEEEELLGRADEIRERKAKAAEREVGGSGNGEGPSRSMGRQAGALDSDVLDSNSSASS